MPVSQSISAREIAALIKKSKSTVIRRAAREGWPCEEACGPGGKCRMYLVSGLPEDVQIRINKDLVPAAAPPAERPAGDPALSQAQIDKALAKADLLRMYLAQLARAGWGRKEAAREKFLRAYNSGLAFTELHAKLGPVNAKTIEGWKVKLRKNGGDTLSLADTRGYWRSGRQGLSEAQQEILLKCALHPNRPKLAEVIRVARAVMDTQGIANGHSDATYRRWLTGWKSENHHIWVWIRQGAKAWNDKCAYYIERDYSLINVGDILVADGHVLNFEIISPWTGKPKRMVLILWLDMKSNFPLGWEIMPTENTQAIAAALRRAILRLGKYPKVAYLDNGKAFGSRFFKGCDLEQAGFAGLFERLDIKTIFAWPYHGQSKTVERFFGTFAELERWCPTYTGTSIEKKPPRLNRGEKIHNQVYHKLTQGRGITLAQAHRAIASWFDAYAGRPQSGHLDGARPLDVFSDGKGEGVDPVELRYLMMSQDVRHIRRNGIYFLGRNYYDPELYGRTHPVTIRYDLQDDSAIWVFDRDGDFLCEASQVDKVHPAANILGNEQDREKLTRHIAHKKSQEKAASVSARDFLEREVLPEHRRQLAAIGLDAQEARPTAEVIRLPASSKQVESELAELARLHADEPTSEPAEEYVPEVADETTAVWQRLPQMVEMDRYEKLLELDIRGVLIPRQYRAFMNYYEQTPEYARYADRFEDHRVRMVMMYQLDDYRTG